MLVSKTTVEGSIPSTPAKYKFAFLQKCDIIIYRDKKISLIRIEKVNLEKSKDTKLEGLLIDKY
jgi:hypothetical protein